MNQQIENLRSSLKGLSAEDRAIISRQGVYEAEQRAVQSLERDANAAKQALAAAAAEFKRLPTAIDTKNMTENGDLLQRTHATFAQWISDVQKTVAEFEGVLADPVTGKPLEKYFSGIARGANGGSPPQTI